MCVPVVVALFVILFVVIVWTIVYSAKKKEEEKLSSVAEEPRMESIPPIPRPAATSKMYKNGVYYRRDKTTDVPCLRRITILDGKVMPGEWLKDDIYQSERGGPDCLYLVRGERVVVLHYIHDDIYSELTHDRVFKGLIREEFPSPEGLRDGPAYSAFYSDDIISNSKEGDKINLIGGEIYNGHFHPSGVSSYTDANGTIHYPLTLSTVVRGSKPNTIIVDGKYRYIQAEDSTYYIPAPSRRQK